MEADNEAAARSLADLKAVEALATDPGFMESHCNCLAQYEARQKLKAERDRQRLAERKVALVPATVELDSDDDW